MDSDIERVVELTGLSLPLAAQMVVLIVNSGASHSEAKTALEITGSLLQRLTISLYPADVDQEDPV